MEKIEWKTEKESVFDKNGKLVSPAVGHFEVKPADVYKELAKKLFIQAIVEYNKVRIKVKKQNKVCSEDKLIDEAFNVWYENVKEEYYGKNACI